MADLDNGSERSGVFGAARNNTTPPFEKKESILHEMAEFVEIFVVFPRGKLYIENGQSDKPCPAVKLYLGGRPSAPVREESQEAT